jgi:membrane protein
MSASFRAPIGWRVLLRRTIVDTLEDDCPGTNGARGWKRRLLAIALTVALAVFVVFAAVLVTGGEEAAEWLARQAHASDVIAGLWSGARWPLAFLLVMLAVDLLYYFAPNTDDEWAWVTPGALLATASWLATSIGFRLYVQNVGLHSAVHGAIGTVISFMLWLYLSGLALLIGAELNAEIRKASNRQPRRPRAGP